MAYATPADLASFMQVPSVDTASATLILQIVADEMDDYVGQPLGHQDVVDLLIDGTGAAEFNLPGFPVTAVASLEVLQADSTWQLLVDGTDYAWSDAGIVRRRFPHTDPAWPSAISPAWPAWPASIRASYSRGEGTVSGAVKGVNLSAAARMMANPLALQSEQIGGMSLRYGAKTGAIEFSALELRVLDRASDIVIA